MSRRLLCRLSDVLEGIAQSEDAGDYELRGTQVLEALILALQLGYRGGICWDHDSTDPDVQDGRRAVVVIELPVEPLDKYDDGPTFQARWHMNEYQRPWDEGTTERKYAQIGAWIEALS